MKHFFLFVLALMISTSLLRAQEPRLGLTGGFNFAHWKLGHKSSSFENKARLGIFLGADVEMAVTDPLTVQVELLFAQFGSTFKDGSAYARYKTGYLLLPVLGKYNFENGISILAGPEIGLLMSAKSDIDGVTYNFKDEMKKTDLFFVLGAEYHLKNGLALGFRIHHGLTNVEDGASTSLHNRGFALTASYKFKQSLREILNNIF